MKKILSFMKDISEFEENLYFEILKSEKLRILFMMLLFFLMSIVAVALKVFLTMGPAELDPVIGKQFPVYKFMILAASGLFYELFILIFLNKIISGKIHIPEAARYANLTVETTLVAGFVYSLARDVDAVVALNSPMYNLFFYLIILSTLRLNFFMAIIGGIVAALEFSAIALLVLPGNHPKGFLSFFYALPPYLGKSVMLLVGGLLAGFVAGRIRKNMEVSIKVLNERNKITGMFGQYVSPAVVEKLLSHETEYTGEVKFVTMMFLDIRDFTRFSEKKTPEEVVEYLNKLFTHLIAIINNNNGMINKFLGDGFMAVFGAPISDTRDAHNAIKAGFEILKKIDELNNSGIIETTRVGIGMHCGQAVTGNIGSSERKEYTIIGDTVNLASRVEQLNKEYSATFLVTKDVFDKVHNLNGEEMAPVKVKGRDDAVIVYKLA